MGFLILPNKKSSPGFTLIELLVVITLLGVLTSIGSAVFFGQTAKARDAKRKQDLFSLAQGLEIYYQRYNRYPCSLGSFSAAKGSWIKDEILGSTEPQCSGNKVFDAQFINPMPQDPKSDDVNFLTDEQKHGYYYWSGKTDGQSCPKNAGQYFMLVTRLENSADPDRNQQKMYKDCQGRVIFDPTQPPNYRLFVVSNQ